MLIACNSDTDTKSEPIATNSPNEVVNNPQGQTTVEWLDSTYQYFGKIRKGQVLEISFRMKNTGNSPLVISNTSAGCGCTVTETPKEPIAPGEEQTIRAKYDSKSQNVGRQVKTIMVTANTSPNPVHTLTFAVDVE